MVRVRCERLLLLIALLCFGWVWAVSVQAIIVQRAQRDALDRVLQHGVRGERATAAAAPPPLVGRLEIPRLGVSAMVLRGDDDDTLRTALGYLPDTPLPWDGGNTAVAGHRDTFFRPLERIRAGDDIYLDTPRGRLHYRVNRHLVVDPEDLWVREPSSRPTLTLITCFPFRYVGPAPRRFIVQAERV